VTGGAKRDENIPFRNPAQSFYLHFHLHGILKHKKKVKTKRSLTQTDYTTSEMTQQGHKMPSPLPVNTQAISPGTDCDVATFIWMAAVGRRAGEAGAGQLALGGVSGGRCSAM
jgi:hypothetical protein